MKKQKTRQELVEDSSKILKAMTIVFIISLVVAIIIGAFFEKKSDNLKTQLSECQDEVSVWTLNVVCDYDWEEYEYISYEFVLNNYTKYLELLEDLEEEEYCEVIE